MAKFDPDAYLARSASAPAAFDPDAYLRSKDVAAPTTPPNQIPGDGGRDPAPAAVRPSTDLGRPATLREKIVGAGEAGAQLVNTVIGAPIGAAGGAVVGALENAVGAVTGRPTARGNVERRAAQGMQLLSSPNPVTGRQMSPTGQEYTEEIGGAMSSLPAYLGMIGPVGGMQAGLTGAAQVAPAVAGPAARTVAQAASRGVSSVLERAPGHRAEAPTAGTMASGGAAGADIALQRAERAANLPVPIELTKGQRTRDFADQRFERETAKDPELGAPIRERYTEQNRALQRNLEALEALTGAEAPDVRATGTVVTQALAKKANEKKAKIKQAYDEARAAGDMADPVSYDQVKAYIDEQTPTTREQLAPIIKMVDEQLAKNDPDGAGTIPLSAMEDIRQAIRKNTQFGTPNSVHGGELIGRIDKATDGAGGDLYKRARALYANYSAEFKNQGAVAKLLRNKPGTTDRAVALEDVVSATMLRGSRDDVSAVRKSLLGAGPEGRQAWRELQGATVAHLREQATKNVARNEAGDAIISAAGLDRAVKSLDADGKLELVFGKKGAEQIRDINDLAKDVMTSPPGSVNTSNTASVLLTSLDTLATFTATGGTLPVPAVMALRKLRDTMRGRSTRKKVDAALKPDERVKIGEPKALDTDARPFDDFEPAAPPAPPARQEPVGLLPAPTMRADAEGRASIDPKALDEATFAARYAPQDAKPEPAVRPAALLPFEPPTVIADSGGRAQPVRGSLADAQAAVEDAQFAARTGDPRGIVKTDVLAANGDPFKSKSAATRAMNEVGPRIHEVVQIGPTEFVVRRKVTPEQVVPATSLEPQAATKEDPLAAATATGAASTGDAAGSSSPAAPIQRAEASPPTASPSDVVTVTTPGVPNEQLRLFEPPPVAAETPAGGRGLNERGGSDLRSVGGDAGGRDARTPDTPASSGRAADPVGNGEGRAPDPADAPVATKRGRELARLREQASDPDVLKALDDEIKVERRQAAIASRAREYLRLAEQTEDPSLKALLEQKARELGPSAKEPSLKAPKPTQETPAKPAKPDDVVSAPLPAVQPAARGVAAVEVPPTEVGKWQQQFQFGRLDARTSRQVAQAVAYDAQAVDAAMVEHANSPSAFARVISEIVEQGKIRESNAGKTRRGGKSVDQAPDGTAGSASGATEVR